MPPSDPTLVCYHPLSQRLLGGKGARTAAIDAKTRVNEGGRDGATVGALGVRGELREGGGRWGVKIFVPWLVWFGEGGGGGCYLGDSGIGGPMSLSSEYIPCYTGV